MTDMDKEVTPGTEPTVETVEAPVTDDVETFGAAEEPDVTFVVGGEAVSFDEESDDDSAGDAEEGTKEGASTPKDETAESATAPTEPTADTAATDAPQVETPAEPEPEPLRFKADGREFEVPGRRDGDNYVITADNFARIIQPRLADRGAWQQERESYRRQIAALAPEKNPEVVRAREIIGQFQKLLDGGPEAVIDWAEKFESNKEALLARAEAAAARAEAESARGHLTEQERAQQVQELQGHLNTAVDNLLIRAKEVPEYADLDMEHVKHLIAPVMSSVFFRADHDMPEYGIKAGEIGVNVEVVDAILTAEAQRHSAFAKQREAAAAAAEAAKRNAAALGTTPKKAPPVVTDKAAPGQAKEPPAPVKSVDEWEKRLSAVAFGR